MWWGPNPIIRYLGDLPGYVLYMYIFIIKEYGALARQMLWVFLRRGCAFYVSRLQPTLIYRTRELLLALRALSLSSVLYGRVGSRCSYRSRRCESLSSNSVWRFWSERSARRTRHRIGIVSLLLKALPCPVELFVLVKLCIDERAVVAEGHANKGRSARHHKQLKYFHGTKKVSKQIWEGILEWKLLSTVASLHER